MKERLRKLTRNTGSVLFLVLSIMTILIIAASAAYYVVLSNQGAVQIRYNDDQAYQTAMSVDSGVSDYIDAYLTAVSKSDGKLSTTTNRLVENMLALNEGDSLKTKAADFDEYNMGDYEVEIKKVKKVVNGEDTTHTFEIKTTASVNGQKSLSVTQIKTITTGPAEYFTRFLTSTGGRPEDVFVIANSILSEVYFENEFTSLGYAHINDDIFCTGTFCDNGMQYTDRSGASNDHNIVVGENYYVSAVGGTSIYANEIYVGGDFINYSPGWITKPIYANKVYALGDMLLGATQNTIPTVYYINGDCHIYCATTNNTFYVNGDLYLHFDGNSQGKFEVLGDVILDGTPSTSEGIKYKGKVLKPDGTEPSLSITNEWGYTYYPYASLQLENDVNLAEQFDSQLIASKIATDTAKQNYHDWKAEKYFNDNLRAGAIDVHPGASTDPYTQWYQSTSWSGYNIPICTISENAILHSWDEAGFYAEDGTWRGAALSDNKSIIIDATVKDIYVYLDSDGRDTFTFGQSTGSQDQNVFIIGNHSVIFILPDGVDLKMDLNTYIGHAGIVLDLAGKSGKDGLIDLMVSNTKVYTLLSGDSGFNYFGNVIDSSNDRIKSDIIDSHKIPGANPNEAGYHNNIFIVSSGNSSVIDLGSGGYALFYGYVYAPNARLISGKSGQNAVRMFGGLIVGSYTYNDENSGLLYTSPYDYYDVYDLDNPGDIVKYLIGNANGTGEGGAASALKGWGTVGYYS